VDLTIIELNYGIYHRLPSTLPDLHEPAPARRQRFVVNPQTFDFSHFQVKVILLSSRRSTYPPILSPLSHPILLRKRSSQHGRSFPIDDFSYRLFSTRTSTNSSSFRKFDLSEMCCIGFARTPEDASKSRRRGSLSEKSVDSKLERS